MTLQTDGSVGLAKESTYGTAVTVTRFLEYTEQGFTDATEFVTGEGLRVGKVVARSSRRSAAKIATEGSLTIEQVTKGTGLLWEAILGSGTSTVRSGSIYQQLFRPAVTDPMPSYTIQTGVPPIGGGTTLAHTFAGCVVDKWELSAEAGGLVELSTDWVGKDLATGTAYASPSYSASASLFTFVHGAITLGVNGTDTLTAPTTTALGSTTPATAATNITKISIKGENHVDDGGFVFSSGGKRGRAPVYGLREFMGTITAEFTAATLRDYYLNQTSLQLILTFVSTELISGSTYATLQVVIPALVFEGDVPQSDGGDVVSTDIDFTVLDGESATYPIYVVLVTADTAL